LSCLRTRQEYKGVLTLTVMRTPDTERKSERAGERRAKLVIGKSVGINPTKRSLDKF
jgi:hypothetical protein